MANLDRIFTSVPLNKTAGRVVGGGTHYEPTVNCANHEHHENRPAIRPFASLDKKVQADARELMDRIVGRLQVLGLADNQGDGQKSRKHNARWVVRCACGSYEFRTAKAIKNPNNTNDMCQHCRHFEIVKKRHARLGAKEIGEFLSPKGDAS